MRSKPLWKLSAAEEQIYDAVVRRAGSPIEVALDPTDNTLDETTRVSGNAGWIACYTCRDLWIERVGEFETGAKLTQRQYESIVGCATPTAVEALLPMDRRLRLRQRVVRRVHNERPQMSGDSWVNRIDLSSHWKSVDQLSRERDDVARWFDERIQDTRRAAYAEAVPRPDNCDGILAERSSELGLQNNDLADTLRRALKQIELCDEDWKTEDAIQELYVVRWVL